MTDTLEKKMIKTTQKVNLVEGKFTPSEANHIINTLIDEKINFHKIKRLSLCEGYEHFDTSYENNRVDELNSEKITAKEYISLARQNGYKVAINGTLEISFIKP